MRTKASAADSLGILRCQQGSAEVSRVTDATDMETLVLIPQDFSLAVSPGAARGRPAPAVSVWSTAEVPRGTLYHPFQGTIRIDKLDVYTSVPEDDCGPNSFAWHDASIFRTVEHPSCHIPLQGNSTVLKMLASCRAKLSTRANDIAHYKTVRHRFGLFDEVTRSGTTQVRHCNWVRFLRVAEQYGPQVNLVCAKVKGEPNYETVKPIAANTELVVYFLPERPEELFFVTMRNNLYRQTMGSILEDYPLDLSMSLLCRALLPASPPSGTEDEHKSVSGDSLTSSCTASSAGDLHDAPAAAVAAADAASHRTPKARPPRGERALLPCEVCGKAFDRPSLLKRHMRTHTGEKPHVCMVCNKGFSTSSSLNTHRRIHSGEKPHQCQHCGKRFTASSNLYYHRMTHIKEKPHKCSLCSKSFPTPGDLKSHMYVHSGSWPYKCHICSRGFSKHTNLKNHLFLHTGKSKSTRFL